MYLINPDHCFYEIIDNAVDEYSAGRCTDIDIEVKEEGPLPAIIITDNGGGIPTSLSKDSDYKDKCQALVALTTLSAGGKMGMDDGYKTATSGLHGVGASCVNAVSEDFRAVIYHDKTRTNLEFKKGIVTNEEINTPVEQNIHGTSIYFKLDKELWEGEDYNWDIIKRRLKQLSYLNPGLKIKFTQFQKEPEIYKHENGIEEYFKDLTQNKNMLDSNSFVIINQIIDNEVLGPVQISSAFSYSDSYSSEIYSFVNNVSTTSGDHVTGFNTGISKAITQFFNESDKYKSLIKNLTTDDCKEGLIGIISIKLREVKFEGQSKNSIKMPQVRTIVNNVISDYFKLYLEQHPIYVKLLADKIEKAIKARVAAKKAREAIRNAKSTLESSLPGKLTSCHSRKPEECEIYIVEGDSAGGTACQGRDSKTQAILPVFGKILNTEKAREADVLNNVKLLDVIKALKCGIGKTFDINKLRYHKVIIMADQDSDGGHISTLWITFFYRHLPEIIKNGYLYIALSPLYRVTEKVGKKEKFHYFFNDEDLSKFKSNNQYKIDYIKGLGELQASQLWDSTMNPETRHIIRVTIDDAEKASQAIETCMGDNVEIRKKFILNNVDFSKVVE